MCHELRFPDSFRQASAYGSLYNGCNGQAEMQESRRAAEKYDESTVEYTLLQLLV